MYIVFPDMQRILPTIDVITTRCIPTDTVRFAGMFALVNRELNAGVMRSKYGKIMWEKIAREITGFDNICIVHDDHGSFMHRIKLLICPWLSMPVALPFEVPNGSSGDMFDMRIEVVGEEPISPDGDKRLLKFYLEDGEMFLYTMPCIDGGVIEILKGGGIKFPEPAPSIELDGSVYDVLEADLSGEKIYKVYVVHKSVYAVIEFSESIDRSGVFFFATGSNRMLRYMQCPDVLTASSETDICFRSMEMWFLTGYRIFYYGPGNPPAQIASPAERVSPALWLAFQGDLNGVMQYLRDYNLDINTADLKCRQTVLHYAAMGGDVDVINNLIEYNADIEAEDNLYETPLSTAVRYLQHRAVRALLKAGAMVTQTAFRAVGWQVASSDHIIETVDALVDTGHPDVGILLLNIREHVVIQHLIERGVPTSPEALHKIISSIGKDDAMKRTVEMFSKEEFDAVVNGKTALQLAEYYELSVEVIAHIQAMTWLV